MSCNEATVKKSVFCEALNSFGAAARTGDVSLIKFSLGRIEEMLNGISFAPEKDETETDEAEE